MKGNIEKALEWWATITATMKKVDLIEKYLGEESLLKLISDDEILYIWEKETFVGKIAKFIETATPESILENCEKWGLPVENIIEEKPKSMNFVEGLKEYFKTTSREKVLEDWAKTAEYDNVKMGINEPIENEIKFKFVWMNVSTGEFSNSWFDGECGDVDYDTLKIATKDHWKLIKFQCINEPEFEFNNLMKLR